MELGLKTSQIPVDDANELLDDLEQHRLDWPVLAAKHYTGWNPSSDPKTRVLDRARYMAQNGIDPKLAKALWRSVAAAESA
jgi:hypothetical protein